MQLRSHGTSNTMIKITFSKVFFLVFLFILWIIAIKEHNKQNARNIHLKTHLSVFAFNIYADYIM